MSTGARSAEARAAGEEAAATLAVLAAGLAANAHHLATERDGLVRAARESRALFDVLAGQLPIGIALHGLDLRFRFVNAALERLHGVGFADHIGRRCEEVLGPLGTRIDDELRAVAQTGEVRRAVQVDGEMPGLPGQTAHQLRSFFPILDAEGALMGVGSTVLDVTEGARATHRAREQHELYEALLTAVSELGEAVVILDGARIVHANEAAAIVTGRSAAELLALPSLLDVIDPDQQAAVRARLRGVAAGQTPQRPGFRTTVVRPDGTRVAMEAAGKRMGSDAERIVIIGRDVTDAVAREAERERLLAVQQSARRASEADQARLRLIADASALLEHDEPLRALADLLAGRLADACVIAVRDRPGDRAAAGAQAELARLASAPPVAVAEARVPGDGTALVPLVARGRSVGLLSLAWTDHAHRPGREEWTLISAVSQRIALAVDSAGEHRGRAQIAQTLQASLFAGDLPAIAGAQLAAEYVPGGRGFDVGGDFYDAFPLGEGAWALVIGDVCGKGAEAAAVTALARYTLRALAPRVGSPAAALGLLNDELLRRDDTGRFISAALLRLEPRAGGGARVVAASGGHPAPLLLRGGGGGEALTCTGMLLGVQAGVSGEDCEVELAPGDSVVLYTDGVTEAARAHVLTPADLIERLGAVAASPPAAIARAVVALAETAATGSARDDLAVLVATMGS